MRRRGTATFALALLAPVCPALAVSGETFQAEAGLSYSRFKSDSVRMNTAGADATWYFEKLPSRPDYPLEQAQFVERAASVGAGYAGTSTDFSGFDKVSDGSSYGANFVFARPDSPLIVVGGYQAVRGGRSRLPSTSEEFETDAQLYQLSAGLYVAKTTDVLVNWARGTSDFKSTASPTQTLTQTGVGLSGGHLMQLPGGDYVALAAAVLRSTLEPPNAASQKEWDYSLQATYYPTHVLGVTAGAGVTRGDDPLAEGETYSAGVRMFFTPAFGVSLAYGKFLAKSGGNDDDRVTLRAALRF